MGMNLTRRIILFLAWFLAVAIGPAGAAWFQRGDTDGSGALDLTDPVEILRFLFGGDPAAVRCGDAADADDSGILDLTDAIYLLEHLFLAGPRPGPTDLFAGCWFDDTADDLDCETSSACQPMGAFFCLDRSPSNGGWGFLWLKDEVVAGISQLADGDPFALVFFEGNVIRFPKTGGPALATPDVRTEAVSFVRSTATGMGTCAKPALLLSLQLAEASAVANRAVIHISDGYNTCGGLLESAYEQEILDEVGAWREKGIPIRVIGIGSMRDHVWLEALAETCGGSYVQATIP